MKKILILTFLALFLAGCTAEVQKPVEPAVIDSQDSIPENTQPSMMENPPQMPPPNMMAQVKEFTIIAKKWEFEPSTIIVNKGDKVRLVVTNIDVDHGIAIPEYGISQKLTPGKTETIEFTADKAGEFRMYCNVYCGSGHKDMDGKLIVK